MTHPALSEYLIHFTSRGRRPPTPEVPREIAVLTPEQRLEEILYTEQLRGFPPYGSPTPVVCFSESRADDAAYLLAAGWEPWGLIFHTNTITAAGGGPIWYARTEQLTQLRAVDPTNQLTPWTGRWDPLADRRRRLQQLAPRTRMAHPHPHRQPPTSSSRRRKRHIPRIAHNVLDMRPRVVRRAKKFTEKFACWTRVTRKWR